MAVPYHSHTFEIPVATDAEVAAGTISNKVVVPSNLGTAAQSNVGDFADAAQGALADSAVQPGDLGDSAGRDVGTTAGTVAAGDDTRVVNAVQTTRTLTGGTGINTIGNLSADRTVSLNAASVSSLAKADETFLSVAVPSGLVADYNIAAQTGTDNSAALLAAAATGKPVFIPEGNYFSDDSQVDRLLEDGAFIGPGHVFSPWTTGGNEQQGKILPVGIPSPVRGEIGAGGIGLGFQGVRKNGPILWPSSPNGYASKPKTVGYHEFNLYPTLPIGMGIGQIGTSNVLFDYGDLSLASPYLEVGDIIGFELNTYKYNGAISGGFALTTMAGGPVNFAANTLGVFRWCYDIREGFCDVSGKVVTIREDSSDFLFGFYYSTTDNRMKINGTWRAVESIQSPKQLTLVDNLGTVTNATFIQKTHIGIATAFRRQSMFGAREENFADFVNEMGEAVLSLQGYAGAGYTRKMPLIVEGGAAFDGSGQTKHQVTTNDGKLGIGETRDNVIASPARFNSTIYNAASKGGSGTTTAIGARIKVLWGDGSIRYLDILDANDTGGIRLQSRDGGGTAAPLHLNEEGGNVGAGAGMPQDRLHATDGAIRASGATSNFNSVAGALMDYFSGWARWVAAATGSAGMQFYTTVSGASALRMQLNSAGYLSLPGTPTAANDAAAAALSPAVAVGECYFRSADGVLVKRLV